jgi:hypothetical protein
MTDTDVLHNDLRGFDKACQRLYDDGLMSEETLVGMHAVAHREAWEMREIKGLDNRDR